MPEDKVLHIHGCAAKREHLIFGHNQMMLSRKEVGNDAEKVGETMDRYHKNPYEYIFKHDDLPEILKDVEYVHVYGLSLSPVDEDYIDWICCYTPNAKEWEISWYSDEDNKRIDKFVFEHYYLRDKVKRVRLEELSRQ